MKLLSPFQNKDKQQEELTRKITRIQEVEELATKSNANLARAEADFNDTLARNRSKWAIEEGEHQDRIKDMVSEIEALENRKQQALVPISMYKREADKLMEEARDILVIVKGKEEQTDFLQEKLEEKLTEIADRENIIEKEEQQQIIARQGIISQQESIREDIKFLNKEKEEFHLKKQQDEANIYERKKEVALAEVNLNAKIEKYARDLEALKIWDKQLKDERETLDREYARNKYIPLSEHIILNAEGNFVVTGNDELYHKLYIRYK